jgi:hypothetical protein
MKTTTKNQNKEVDMRNFLGTAVAVVLSMVFFPNCAGTANAGLAVSVSVGASAGCPDGYVYDECNDCYDDVMDWDNAIILNDNLVGFWVLLPSGQWALRCRSMLYNSGSYEWTFGPWWYDYSISYGCNCHNSYVAYGCPFHGVRFHTYMVRHYPVWHSNYFVFNYNRYAPRVERHIYVNRGRYYRHDEPAIYRTHTVHQSRPATIQSTTVITRNREIDRPVRIDDSRNSESVHQSRPATTQRTTTITRQREVRQPVSNSGGNRSERINTNQGNSRQTEITRTRTTTRENSNGRGNSSSRSDSRSSTRTTHRGR